MAAPSVPPPERLSIALLRAPDVFRNEVPQILGILGFALAAFSDMPTGIRMICGVGGAGALGLYLLTAPANRERLSVRVAGRLVQLAADVHLAVRIEAGDEKLLQQFLREQYGSWYFPELAATLIQRARLRGG